MHIVQQVGKNLAGVVMTDISAFDASAIVLLVLTGNVTPWQCCGSETIYFGSG